MAESTTASAQPNGDALLRVAASAAGAHDLEDVLEPSAEEARRAIGAASLSVSRWERDRNQLRVLVNVGDLGPDEERFPADETYPVDVDPKTERLLSEGEPYFAAVDDPDLDDWSAARLERLGKESEVGVPILVEGEVWGEVFATTAPGSPRFRGDDVRFLEAIAGQLALVIGRAEQFSRVSRLAYEDPLTGLANRRAIEERLARATERDVQLAVLLADVDDLKGINDEQGHEGGDRALLRVSEALVAASASHPGALVGRLAGDEFCVVMENGTLDDARAVASSALEGLATSPDGAIMISCGAAARGPGVSTPAQLLRAADAALYRAKRGGGRQLFTAGTPLDPPTRAERRAMRRSTPGRLRATVRQLALDLDGRLAGKGALERIEAVGAGLAAALNAAAWAVSYIPTGSSFIRTVSLVDERDKRLEGLRLQVDHEVYSIFDYPATARLVEAGSGAFTLKVDDESGDAAERALLQHFGRTGLLAAAAADHQGTWLLELYADAATVPLDDAAVDASLLMRAAIPPRPATPGPAAQLARRTEQLRLLTGLGQRLASQHGELSAVRATVSELQRRMGADVAAGVRLRDDDMVELVAGAGLLGSQEHIGVTAPVSRGLVGRCMRDRKPVLVGDVRKEPDYHPTPGGVRTLSELDVPLEVGGRVWGALSVQSCELDAFDAEDVEIVKAVATQLGSALERL